MNNSDSVAKPTELSCPSCNGTGTEADYVGLEMRCVEAECSRCGGKGTIQTSPTELSDEKAVKAQWPKAHESSVPMNGTRIFSKCGYGAQILGINWADARSKLQPVQPAPSKETHRCPDCGEECGCFRQENHCWHECNACDCGHELEDHEDRGDDYGQRECSKCSCARYVSESPFTAAEEVTLPALDVTNEEVCVAEDQAEDQPARADIIDLLSELMCRERQLKAALTEIAALKREK